MLRRHVSQLGFNSLKVHGGCFQNHFWRLGFFFQDFNLEHPPPPPGLSMPCIEGAGQSWLERWVRNAAAAPGLAELARRDDAKWGTGDMASGEAARVRRCCSLCTCVINVLLVRLAPRVIWCFN